MYDNLYSAPIEYLWILQVNGYFLLLIFLRKILWQRYVCNTAYRYANVGSIVVPILGPQILSVGVQHRT